MNLQFQCPFCQLLLTVDASVAGSQVQCPGCQRPFMVNAMPQVQATVVATPAVAVAAPAVRATAPGARPPGPPQAKPKPAAARTRQQIAQEERAAENKVKLVMLGVMVLGGGLIWGVMSLLGKVQSTARPERALDMPPEVVAREKAQREKLQRERDALAQEESESRAKSVKAVSEIFSAPQNVAEQIILELENTSKDHRALCADADPSNDPKNVTAYYTQRLGERAEANNVIMHWLGGKPGRALGETMWGDAARERRSKGETADFLLAGDYRGSGTGFFVANDGWLVTNEHVVGSATEVDIRDVDGKMAKARVIKTDAAMDLALLKVEGSAPAALSLRQDDLSLGQLVFTVGFPNAWVQGVQAKFTEGSVSSLAGLRDDPNDYQISVPLQGGNSGGALIDMSSGLVAGVCSARLTGESQNVNYAVKGTCIAKLIRATPEAAGIPAPVKANAASDRTALIDQVRRATVLVLVK